MIGTIRGITIAPTNTTLPKNCNTRITIYQEQKENIHMKEPIIEIKRASEETIKALINAGILVVTDSGLTTK